MCDGSFSKHPAVLMAANEALVLIIINCWPRVRAAQRVEQVLRILSVCWLNFSDAMANGPQLSTYSNGRDTKRCINDVVSAMRSMSKDDDEIITKRLEMICVQDDRLRDLFIE